MRKDLTDGNGVEKRIVISAIVPENFDGNLVDMFKDVLGGDLYSLGCHLVDVREFHDETAYPDTFMEGLSSSFTLDNGLLVLIEKNSEGSFDFNIWEPEPDGSRGMLYSGGILPEDEVQTLSAAVACVCKHYNKDTLMSSRDAKLAATPQKPALSEQVNNAKTKTMPAHSVRSGVDNILSR